MIRQNLRDHVRPRIWSSAPWQGWYPVGCTIARRRCCSTERSGRARYSLNVEGGTVTPPLPARPSDDESIAQGGLDARACHRSDCGTGAFAAAAFAAAGRDARSGYARQPVTGNQLPDWLSSETAARLAIGIDVLIPSYVPAPFGGEPEVQASDGYYSLYWLIPGAPPTYLRVTGTAGGEIPAFSYYDRNVQLVQNDSVMGYPAWHDVTPIYDLVYWQVGNVVYTVESHNMAGDTTMGIANSLMSLVVPDSGGEGGEQSAGRR